MFGLCFQPFGHTVVLLMLDWYTGVKVAGLGTSLDASRV